MAQGPETGGGKLVKRSPGAAPAQAEAKPAAAAADTPRTRIQGGLPGAAAPAAPDTAAAMDAGFPVTGWLVVVKGPGLGQAVAVYSGMNDIGRGEERTVRLDFGDANISRDAHAFVTYDHKDRTFFFNHNGQRNIVRHNGRAVMAPQQLAHGDMVEIGETHLRFVAFCGPDFDWSDIV